MSQVIFGNIVIVTLLYFIVAHMAVSEMVQVTMERDTGSPIVDQLLLLLICFNSVGTKSTMTLETGSLKVQSSTSHGEATNLMVTSLANQSAYSGVRRQTAYPTKTRNASNGTDDQWK